MIRRYFLWPLILLAIMLCSSCDPDQSARHLKMASQLIEVDEEFARQSIAVGAHESFLQYIDDSCVLLRPNRNPVVGRQKIEEIYSTPDTSFTLNWKPLFADIAESGDLGYTYGIYTVQMDSPEGKQVTKEGTYVTIWKKDKTGKWKFVLDTGNQGLGEKTGD